MTLPDLRTATLGGGQVIASAQEWLLSLPADPLPRYRLAELNDYSGRPRHRFPWHPPLILSLEARVSDPDLPGTWGFGLWNHPFGAAIGFGGTFLLPALPNAIWFFYASPENWLSFCGDHLPSPKSSSEPDAPFPQDNASSPNPRPAAASTGHSFIHLPSGGPEQPLPAGSQATNFSSIPGDFAFHYSSPFSPSPENEPPGNGFLAQVFSSPRIPSVLLATAGLLALPMLLPSLATRRTRRWLRRLARTLIREQTIRLRVDPTDWHAYRLEWSPNRCAFWVDHVRVWETSLSPHPPLGLALWLDNQFAAFTPQGELTWGVLPNPEAWLRVRHLQVKSG